jgi:hypothetical protein
MELKVVATAAEAARALDPAYGGHHHPHYYDHAHEGNNFPSADSVT